MTLAPQNLLQNIRSQETVFSDTELREAWANSLGKHLQLLLFDDQYHAVPEALWLQLIQATHTRDLTYIHSFFDCNSFADCLKGLVKAHYGVNGIGFVADFSGKHAFNVVLVASDDPKQPTASFRFVEPQRDGWIKPQSKPCYDLAQGMVIF